VVRGLETVTPWLLRMSRGAASLPHYIFWILQGWN
jgi:hypothetical protein